MIPKDMLYDIESSEQWQWQQTNAAIYIMQCPFIILTDEDATFKQEIKDKNSKFYHHSTLLLSFYLKKI